MIVISGALVLVTLVLLVAGLTAPDLQFVYGSIVAGLLALVALGIGVQQRRSEPQPAAALPGGDAGPGAQPAPVQAGHAAPGATAPVDLRKQPQAEPVAAEPVATGSVAAVEQEQVEQEEVEQGELEPAPAVHDALDQEAVDEEVVDEEVVEQGLARTGGTVLVVTGRPRYHVEGCRYLNGKTVEATDLLSARDDGYTPCGVCKPDRTLVTLYEELLDAEEAQDVGEQADVLPSEEVVLPPALEPAREVEDPQDVEEPGAAREPDTRDDLQAGSAPQQTWDADPEDDQVPADAEQGSGSRLIEPVAPQTLALELPSTAPAAPPATDTPSQGGARSGARSPRATRASAAAVSAAAPRTSSTRASSARAASSPAGSPVAEPPGTTARRGTSRPTTGARSGASAPSAVRATPATPAPRPAGRRGTVVVIPDRGKFHRAECRYVRDVPGITQLTATQALRQGYDPCGVCKP